jgi:hypothetical protein
MSAAGTPVCAEAIGDETLAFWRDGFLRDAAMARRLNAHTPGCASCQRRLAAMESFGAAVRRQRIPLPILCSGGASKRAWWADLAAPAGYLGCIRARLPPARW